MHDIEWVENGIKTIEKIDHNTQMEYYTPKLSPTEIFEALENELDSFNVAENRTCENLEVLAADVLYTIMVLSQRNISNHIG